MIKYYSINDMTCNYFLRESVEIIKKYQAEKIPQDVNEMIEVYNIKKYFDNKIFLKGWTTEDIYNYQNIIGTCYKIVAKFYNSINNDNFITIYENVCIDYKDDFWELFDKFNVYKYISDYKFQELMDNSQICLHELLKYKKTVEHFGDIIRNFMLNNNFSAELLLYKYELNHNGESNFLYFPKELSNRDKEIIICNYINSEETNLNYLRLIANIQSSKDKIEISPITLLNAKKKIQILEKQLFGENSGICTETTLMFSKSQDDVVITDIKGQAITITYSTKWIEENMDYPTILNNFIYLFNIVDLQMRCILVNKYNLMNVFERSLFVSSKNAYIKGGAFSSLNVLSLLQIAAYYNQLLISGIRLEEVVEWFFKFYLSTEFGAFNFKLTMPSANSTLLEKCTNIMPAMEAVLKQFTLYVQNGKVDFELLEIRSDHLIYKNIPSLVYNKYVYGLGDEFKSATFLLFSDQSSLGYDKENKKSYKNLYELLCNKKIQLNHFMNFNISQVQWLIDYKYLSIDGENNIVFSDKYLIMILKELYFNEVISYWKCSKQERIIMDCLKKKNVIEFESSLFSRPEQNYINYFLNKSQFNNGLDLRNKYSHMQPCSEDNDEIHVQNYMILLRLFIITVIKINDEFCILDELKGIKE